MVAGVGRCCGGIGRWKSTEIAAGLRVWACESSRRPAAALQPVQSTAVARQLRAVARFSDSLRRMSPLAADPSPLAMPVASSQVIQPREARVSLLLTGGSIRCLLDQSLHHGFVHNLPQRLAGSSRSRPCRESHRCRNLVWRLFRRLRSQTRQALRIENEGGEGMYQGKPI